MSADRYMKPPIESERIGQEELSHPLGGPPRVFGSPRFAILVLLAAVLAAYANSLRCAFVFDDQSDIIDNSSIRHLWPLWDVFLVRSARAPAFQSRPVVNLSFALDYAISGLNTPPYHLTNLVIHVLAGLALLGVVRRTLLLPRLRDRFGRASAALALAVALLWALHPLQTESVTYITQRVRIDDGVVLSGGRLRPHPLKRLDPSLLLGRGDGGRHTALAGLEGSGRLAADHDSLVRPGVAERIVRRMLASAMGDVPRVAGCLGRVCPAAAPRGSAPLGRLRLPLSWFEYACSQPGVILHYLRLVFWPHPLVLDYAWPPARDIGDILPGAMVVPDSLRRPAMPSGDGRRGDFWGRGSFWSWPQLPV